ncbi:MAG: hypothetical protein GZ089_00145 [Aromatoleum sp.]|nr:hypothetical protein [Aromatoleum sp.]
MMSRRDLIVLGAGVLAAPSVVCRAATASEAPPSGQRAFRHDPVWWRALCGAAIAVAASIDLRVFAIHPDGKRLTVSPNAHGAPTVGRLTLNPEGILARIATCDIAAVIIDADDGQ